MTNINIAIHQPMNINLLPRKTFFNQWFGLIWFITVLVLAGGLFLVYSVHQLTVEKQLQLQGNLSSLEIREQELLRMIEEKNYVFKWRQLNEEAVLLNKESVDWIPLFETLYEFLPVEGEIRAVSISGQDLSVAINLKTREEVAQYIELLRTSPLFTDVFVPGIQPEGEGVQTVMIIEVVPSYLEGGTSNEN